MLNFPLLLRFKLAGGGYGARAHADTVEQARGFLVQWRQQGFKEFDIEDAKGIRWRGPAKDVNLAIGFNPDLKGYCNEQPSIP